YSSVLLSLRLSFPTRRSSDLISYQYLLYFLITSTFDPFAKRPITLLPFIVALSRTFSKLAVTVIDLFNDESGLEDVVPSDTFNRSEEHTSELQSRFDLVCRLL